MKILHYVDDKNLSWGKPWIDLLLAMGEMNPSLDQHAVCRPDGTLKELLIENGISCSTYKPATPWAPALCTNFKKLVQEIGPDLIHTRLSSAAAIAGYWAPRMGIPVISTIDKYPKKKYYARSDLIIASSSGSARHMIEQGTSTEKITVVTNAIDTEHYKLNPDVREAFRLSEGVGDDEIIILAMGRFVAWKGFDLLIKALGRLPDLSKVRFWLVGSGELESQLKRLAEKELCSWKLQYKFFPFDLDIRRFLWSADIFVQPSYHVPGSGGPETFSLALLEAMAAGEAVIAFDCGGAPDVIKHDFNGWLTPPGDIAQLTSALKHAILQHPSIEIREQAKETALHNDAVVAAQKHLNIYKDIFTKNS
ncbi:Glycosyltransferase involved in cell wall bisynthesis [Ectothiorhodosinus mongolicus]|uniref:Glycosyltransferase involved in cell wall bisynthesis n=1 Tax=Ectothiorhodosinus mongolicus TaxID=233100 RepID=A0A1R3VSG8_9GAMM|nr:glycosyltransferase family 4 protein [Ectothiorhodosinus mongolicus]ULX56733.1 glycosyltransferase family 1 protein [Ectothiorhodosinus mongolicus]SIT67043.1 Glycosyltransferase involved in cell wall bisynthesis [Ectothiorhodosinus mongolicus]